MGDKTILFWFRRVMRLWYMMFNPAAPKFYRLLKRVMRLKVTFIPFESPTKSLVVVVVKKMVSLKYSNRI
jgi:hypothetical protein